MLTEDQVFNLGRIRSYTSYECRVDKDTVEREISFHVHLGSQKPGSIPADLDDERRGDVYPVHPAPAGRMVWLSDWSFNAGAWWLIDRPLAVGGSLGRILAQGQYVYVLNCAVRGGDMTVFSPARAIRYLPGEWIAFCFHHISSESLNLQMRATLRLREVPLDVPEPVTRFDHWGARTNEECFNLNRFGSCHQ